MKTYSLIIACLFCLIILGACGGSNDVGTGQSEWQVRMTGPAERIFHGITYLNGTFMAFGDGRIFTSPDGVSWTSTNTMTIFQYPHEYLHSATYGNGIFVALSSYSVTPNTSGSRIYSSKDGIHWTPEVTFLGTYSGLAYGSGIFVAIGNSRGLGVTADGEIFISTDGLNWPKTFSGDYVFNALTYCKGIFWTVGSAPVLGPVAKTNVILTSPDGMTWRAIDPGFPYSYSYSAHMVCGNGTLMIVAYDASGNAWSLTTEDGITWTASDMVLDPSKSIAVAFGDGIFAATGFDHSDSSLFLTSPDGIAWTKHSMPSIEIVGMTYGNGSFVAIGYDESGRSVIIQRYPSH